VIPEAVTGLAVVVAATVATVAAVVAASGRYSPRVARAWREAARLLGLPDDAVRIGLRGVELRSTSDGTGVSVALRSHRGLAAADPAGQGLRTAIAIDPVMPLPSDLELGPESAGARIAKVVRGRDLETGDASFDREVEVRGDRVVVAALLDRGTRVRVRDAIREGFRVANGRLWGSVDGVIVDPPTLAATVRRLRRLVRALTPPADPVPRLADIARLDPDPGVRRLVLSLLVSRFRDRPETPATLRRALRDREPAVRLEAALALGPEGQVELRFLAERNDVADAARSAAVAALGNRLPAQRAVELLDVALDRGLPLLAAALVDTLGTVDSEAARRRLMAVTRGDDPGLAARAARALGVEPGQLALADGEAGELALASEDDVGRVALAGEEA